MIKHRKTRRKKRKQKKIIIISSTLSLLLLITVGYAAFSTNLSITAKGNIKEYTTEDYIKDGLFAFYDGIENTSSGHGLPTDTWYNKALDLNPSIATTAQSTLTGFNASSWTNDNGLLFDGVDDMVDTGYLQEVLGQQITLSFTVYTASNSPHRGYFGYHGGPPFNKGFTAQFDYGLSLGYYGEKVRCSFGISEAQVQNLILNKKANITAIIDVGNRIALYVNDQLIQETQCTNSFDPYPNINFIIGKSYPENNRYFEGTMYNFMVYKKALTEDEIKQNYRVNKQRYNLE